LLPKDTSGDRVQHHGEEEAEEARGKSEEEGKRRGTGRRVWPIVGVWVWVSALCAGLCLCCMTLDEGMLWMSIHRGGGGWMQKARGWSRSLRSGRVSQPRERERESTEHWASFVFHHAQSSRRMLCRWRASPGTRGQSPESRSSGFPSPLFRVLRVFRVHSQGRSRESRVTKPPRTLLDPARVHVPDPPARLSVPACVISVAVTLGRESSATPERAISPAQRGQSPSSRLIPPIAFSSWMGHLRRRQRL
jgi:hypothetical protein